MSKQLTLFGTSAKDNKRAGNLIYKDPKSKYEKFIERFVRRNKGQASRESVVMSRAPFHTWRLIYENASVCFCPKMPCTNVHCLTPSPPKRPVDVKRGKSEYVDSHIVSMVLVVTEVSLLHTWLPRFSRGWLSSSSGSPWSRGSRGSLGWCVCFFVFCCSCCFRCWCGYNQM